MALNGPGNYGECLRSPVKIWFGVLFMLDAMSFLNVTIYNELNHFRSFNFFKIKGRIMIISSAML